MSDAEQIASAGLRPPELWRRQMRTAPLTRKRIRAFGAGPQAISVASATTSRLSRFAGTDWAAVGDAATTVDPLSGRGVEYALTDGIAAGRAIAGSDSHRALTGYAAGVLDRFADDLARNSLGRLAVLGPPAQLATAHHHY